MFFSPFKGQKYFLRVVGWSRKAFALALVLGCLFPGNGMPGQMESELRSKANALSNFSSFVDWPPEAFTSPNAPFAICVFGEFAFGTSLAQITATQKVQGRKIEVRWVRKEVELAKCQVIFVSHADLKQYAKVLDVVRDKEILTVGETADFLTAGGAVAFFASGEGVQFEVNLAATNGAHLKVSSRLLALARKVWKPHLEAKS